MFSSQEHEQYIRVLEGRVDEAEHEITRLLESETLLRDDLRQRTQEYETITFQHEREKEVQERAVALLEKQIQVTEQHSNARHGFTRRVLLKASHYEMCACVCF